jgi:(E)-4-hydroxy-3-methylbut-2-enyl-diphosphate synthase
MKASNTLVMVQAYRLLVARMTQLGMNYPLHLGVTEAGDGEDGRIKSAVGIGALLEDGIGDTIRVSLTEDPEAEIPVAQKLAAKFDITNSSKIDFTPKQTIDYFHYNRRKTTQVGNLGDHKAPVVVGNLSEKDHITPANFFAFGYLYSVELDKWNLTDMAADLIYIGNNSIDFEIPGTLQIVQELSTWKTEKKPQHLPICSLQEYSSDLPEGTIIRLNAAEEINYKLLPKEKVVFLIETSEKQKTQLIRKIQYKFIENYIDSPVILHFGYHSDELETVQLYAGSEAGIHFIDGFGDGIWIDAPIANKEINSIAFGILQATRTRISKTEYISCPSCGRTLFDLQETTAKIREKTQHLKGIKIGIMGCIVNGPGEMADADYGYVGSGPGKIHLYKEKTIIKKNVSEESAVESLIELIKENGDWVEPA